ncbi:MAG: hypothetical protein JSW58_12505 [Candidatus Latescibacterota bacterium]|nr:MAG: hypothetical protein JSW58_12505 [Candidatus Latescibacterota bacterium]
MPFIGKTKTLRVTIGVAVIVGSSLSDVGAVTTTKGALVWRSGSSTVPQTNEWDGTSFGIPGPTADVGDYRIMTGAEAPGRDEILIVGVDENNRITGEIRDGGLWNALPFNPLANVSESYWWSFAVAYEQMSSDGIIVWRNGTSGTAGLSYRVWDGSVWSGEQPISTPVSGEPKQMRIATSPHSDEMVLVVSNGSSQDYAIVWSGASWGNSVTLDLGSGDDRTDIFVAYEQKSGHAMVVYGKGATSLYYRVWNGVSWSGEVSLPKPGTSSGNVRWAVLGPDPGSDRIALGVLTFSSDIWLNVWDGTSWGISETATTSAPGVNHPNISVAFESGSGEALATYAESATSVRYRTWSNGVGWSGELPGPDIEDTPNTMVLQADPRVEAIMLSVQDSGSDLNLVLWDGTSWGAPSEQETNTTETKNQPFVFLFDQSNTPPSLAAAIPDTTVAEDNPPLDNYRDLNDVFTDAEDGSALDFAIQSNSNPALVTAVIDPDSALDLGIMPGQSGSATVVVRATDSGLLFVEDTLVVTVSAVNDAPVVAAAIPDTTVAEDNPPLDNYRDLNDVFDDVEDGSALAFSIESNDNPALVTAVIDPDSALDVGFAPNQSGSATIVVRGTDSGLLFAEDTLIVTVTSVNDTPTTVAAIPDTSVAENSPPIDNYRDLNDVFDDVEDGSALTFSIESNSNPALVTAVIDPDSALDMSFAPNQGGNATIVVRATDSGALFVEDTLVVAVDTMVVLVDVPGSLYPNVAFVSDPQLALRIGVDNTTAIGVALNTTSKISFTDGTDVYEASLANPTYVPPAADNFTLTFAPNAVPPTISAPAHYYLTLELAGTDDNSFSYADTLSTARRDSVLIDIPRIRISALPLDVESVNPGQRNTPILALDFHNGYADDRLLDAMIVTNVSFGPGTPSELDGEIEMLYLLDDVDSSQSLTMADTVVAQSTFASNAAALTVSGAWRIPGLGHRSLIITVDVDSVVATDGDQLDAAVVSTSDITFQGSTVIADDFSPLDPLDSFGRLIVDGMVAHQMAVTPSTVDTLESNTNDNWLLTLTLPGNGYQSDTLTNLSIKNYTVDFLSSDFAALEIYRDDGDGLFDSAVDAYIGALQYSGDRYEISGLSEPIDSTVTLHIAADVATSPTNGNHFQPGIPLGGIEVASENDGPIDDEVILGKSFTIRREQKIEVTSLPIPPAVPHPGDVDIPLLLLSVSNLTLQPIELDMLTLLNTSVGPGSVIELDNAFSNAKVFEDDGNGIVDGWDSLVTGGLTFSGGNLIASGLNVAIAPEESKHVLIVSDIDSVCSRDGDTLRVEVSASGSIGFDQVFPIEGIFPMATPQAMGVDGMMAHQLSVFARTDSVILSETQDILAFDFGLPANGYDLDTLHSLQIENLGSATSEHFQRLALYQDGGNGVFDAGVTDDVYVGELSENLIIPGGKNYEIQGLTVALLTTCGAHTRFFISADLRNDFSVGGSIQFAIPVGGVMVASGNDGPVDALVADPSIQIIPKPDQLTVFPYSVGDQIVYPNSKKNLNFGIGFYNGYTFAVTLHEVKLFQVGTALNSEIDSLFAYADIDTNGLFDPTTDSLLVAVAPSGVSYSLGEFDLDLPPRKVSYVFVCYDLQLGVADSVKVDLTLFDSEGMSVTPDGTEIQGEFPVNSPGVDRIDGMIADQIAIEPAPVSNVAPLDPDVLAMVLTIPANGAWPDILEYLSVQNLGSAVDGVDIADVRLWKEAGGNPSVYEPGLDQPIAFLIWNGNAWKNPFAIHTPIPVSGLRTYVTFSVANDPTDGATFQARLPINGILVSSGNDGPIDHEIASPTLQGISTDPLITSLTVDRSFYSIGQTISLQMRLRNEGVDSLSVVRPHQPVINGTGAVSVVSGPSPASVDLPPGVDTVIVWVYSADVAGDVEFCCSAYDQDSLVISKQTCSNVFEIQNRADALPLRLTNAAPATANRGQKNVSSFRLRVDYTGSTEPAAPARLEELTLSVRSAAGTLIPPNSVLDRITFMDARGVNQGFSLTDSIANPVHLRPTTPPFVPPGDSLSLNILCDITDPPTFGSFRLSIGGLQDITVVDDNDGSPVTISPEHAFPWQTTDLIINDPADSVLVSADSSSSITANTGQENVLLSTLRFLNLGDANTAREIVTDLTFAFFNSAGTGVAPGDVVINVKLASGGQTLFESRDVPTVGNTFQANLVTPLILTPGVLEPLDLLVDLQDAPNVPSFHVEVEGSSDVVVRDINTETIVTVSALDPAQMDFPFMSNEIVFQSAATGLVAAFEDKLPPSILPADGDVAVMDIVFTHGDSPSFSSLLLDSLAFRFTDRGGNPLEPGQYFATLGVIHEGETASLLTSLSSISPFAECKLTDPILIAPASSETLSVFVDSKNIFDPTSCKISLDEHNVVVRDANDGSRLFGIAGSFPLEAGPTSLQRPTDLVLCGLVTKMPKNINTKADEVEALDLVIDNANPEGFTSVEVGMVCVSMETSKGERLNPSTLISAARLRNGTTDVASGQISDEEITFNLSPSQFIVPSTKTDTLTLWVDIDARRENTTFRFVVEDTSSTSLIDIVTGGPVTAGTIDNSGYPLKSAFAHLLGTKMEAGFTNFPNPFAAGKESTRITYFLEQPSQVKLTLYTIFGELVRTVLDAHRPQSGLYQDTEWDGRNGDGDIVSNGVYYLVLEIKGSDGKTTVLRRKVGVLR